MADSYIDYFEIDEYAGHFVREVKRLSGLYPAVEVSVLASEIEQAAARVVQERERAGVTRSSLRSGRGSTEANAAELREVLQRFFNHLGALNPKKVSLDLEAFFPGKVAGALTRLKASDLSAKAASVLVGFSAPLHAALPGRAEWEQEIREAHQALASALDQRGEQQSSSGNVSATLKQARLSFLNLYNGVAKPIVRGLLQRLGRADEYKVFFKDLQVNESGPTSREEEDGSPEEVAS